MISCFVSFQFIVLAAVVAVARAGYLGAPAVAAYGAPAYGAYAAPAYGAYAAPAYGGYAAPAYAHGLAAPAAITSQHSNILRTPGNLGQVSTYSKTIDTPYSSVSKSDVRVSNDALAYGAAYHAPVAAYHAPVAAYGAPAYAGAYAAPAAYAAHGLAYSPAAVASHVSFSGLGAYYGW
ncbi:hypothetical protein PR048_024125 [Dryococelus australis]|uniref:Uncharacterized protein n=1 Tax=Dryococelus australis TaxID=614101 RepID=A0ABQ9GVZ9_9NEOP|nr:hypothetical protein PR048_024125 [Dryococelus australis]